MIAALDTTYYDGPWELQEDLRQYKAYLGYTLEAGDVTARVSVLAYDSEWDATDQIPRRAVSEGLIGRRGFIDPDLGGQTERYAVNGSLDFSSWHVTAYLVDYDFSLISNFTYFLEDPLNGDEFEQRDSRVVYGGHLNGEQAYLAWGLPLSFRWGGGLRFDDINEVGLYQTAARKRLDTVRKDRVEELSIDGFTEGEVNFTEKLRAIAGVRIDYYDWDVNAFRDVNSGSGDDSLISPKLSSAYLAADGLELYANWGRGFHSNDVRANTISVNPVSGEPIESENVLVESEGAEIGLRLEFSSEFNAALVGFWLELDSELVFVGDAGTTEPNDGSDRYGVEASVFWQPRDWLAINAAYTYTDADFKQDRDGGNAIPGSVESTFTLGVNTAWANGFSASARFRYLGEAPLVEDNSIRTNDSLLVNAGIAFRRGPLEFGLEVFNVFDSKDDDISYFYTSRLPGEPPDGVEDVHFHPLEPRTLRGSLALHW